MNLAPNEKMLLTPKRSLAYFVSPVITLFTGLILPGLLLPGLIWLIYRLSCYFNDRFVITDQKVTMKIMSVASMHVVSTPIAKINNVSCKQGSIGRFLNCGTVVVQSAATLGVSSFSYVSNPYEVVELLQNLSSGYEQAVKVVSIASDKSSVLCPHCGKYYDDKNAAFCPNCGQRINNLQPSAMPQIAATSEPQNQRTCSVCGKVIPDEYDDCLFCQDIKRK